MKGANDNTYNPFDRPGGRWSVKQGLAEIDRLMGLLEGVCPTRVDLATWRKNRESVAKLHEIRQRTLKDAYDPEAQRQRQRAREKRTQDLASMMEISPFPTIDI